MARNGNGKGVKLSSCYTRGDKIGQWLSTGWIIRLFWMEGAIERCSPMSAIVRGLIDELPGVTRILRNGSYVRMR